MIVTPFSCNCFTTLHISLRRLISTPAVGSSKNKIFGSWLSALAINARRFIPPESSRSRLSFLSHRLKSFKIFSIISGLALLPYNPLV